MNLLGPFAVSLAIALAVLGLAGAGPRSDGFEHDAAPAVFRVGHPNPREMRGLLRNDPRAPGLPRVAVLEDSVGFGGAPAWPEMLADRLGLSLPDREIVLPPALTERDRTGFAADQESAVSARDAFADHARHAALLRESAGRAGAAWVATAEAFAPAGVPDTSLFTADRIHLSAAGHALLASLVERSVLESNRPSVEAPR